MSSEPTATGPKESAMPHHVTFMEGNGNLPIVEINTGASHAELYLHGAQVTHFQKQGEPPVLFLSKVSRFEAGTPIRGGVPIVLPWFGQREGEPSHGFARRQSWQLRGISTRADGSMRLRLHLPPSPESSILPPFEAAYSVSVGKVLKLELVVTNTSENLDFVFENCLHTYFTVGDISSVKLTGLKGATYLDQCQSLAQKTQEEEELLITGETDRIYTGHSGEVQIIDPKLGRRITISKEGAASTVVWNPWSDKAQVIPDLGNDEYPQFVCVESGNVGPDKLTLKPGETSTLSVSISTSAV
jgi:D-hexose-6-phosphate mutarotase